MGIKYLVDICKDGRRLKQIWIVMERPLIDLTDLPKFIGNNDLPDGYSCGIDFTLPENSEGEKALAAYFQEHRDDTSIWNAKSVPVTGKKRNGN